MYVVVIFMQVRGSHLSLTGPSPDTTPVSLIPLSFLNTIQPTNHIYSQSEEQNITKLIICV